MTTASLLRGAALPSLLLGLGLAACSHPNERAPIAEGAGGADAALAGCPDHPLRADARRSGALRVLVTLDVGTVERPEDVERRVAGVADQVIAALNGTRARVLRRYRSLPFLALEIDEPALCRLLRMALVREVRSDRAEAPGGPR